MYILIITSWNGKLVLKINEMQCCMTSKSHSNAYFIFSYTIQLIVVENLLIFTDFSNESPCKLNYYMIEFIQYSINLSCIDSTLWKKYHRISILYVWLQCRSTYSNICVMITLFRMLHADVNNILGPNIFF